MKTFIKEHFFPIVWIKRKIQFALADIRHRVDARRVANGIERRVKELQGRAKYRVAFLIYSAGEFQFEGVFRLMLKDPKFDPFVVVIPENLKGIDNDRRIAANVEMLRQRYGETIHNPIVEKDYRKVEDKCDFAITSNPYDHNTDEAYRIVYLSKHGIPVVMSNYFYYHGSTYSEKSLAKKTYISYAWRYYAENAKWKEQLDKNQPELRCRNRVRTSGSSKLDLLSEVGVTPHGRKRVILSPHHSIRANVLPNYGNFDHYAEFVLTLPARYPQIDWIFRPHPLLPATLEANGIWQQGKWDRYLEKLLAYPNITYLPNIPYWDMFVNSDGIIQDCGSFLAEYHFSGHPQCYVIQSDEHIRTQMSEWGLELLSWTYAADSQEKIIDYIENVILKGNDVKAEGRRRFVEERMMPNYPHASEWILADLRKDLGLE